MALHELLRPYRDRKYIRKLSRPLAALERDLAVVKCRDLSVRLIEEVDPRSFMDRFLAFRNEVHIDRVLCVDARLRDRILSVFVPMHRHEIWPYALEIPLLAPVTSFAAYQQGFVRRHWITQPQDAALEEGLQSLRLPQIKWSHADRFRRYRVRRAFEIVPGQAGLATWRIRSGYFLASLLGGKLPLVSSFAAAVPRIERLLSDLAGE